ncbi:MAG: outer membrane beta-barrel protein [Haliscomenobacter sp.]|nr:outer membrane beta-barrel protein [Haliscomenobacter sp.]
MGKQGQLFLQFPGSNAQEYSSAFRTPFNALIEGQGDNAQTRHFLLVQSDLTLQLPRRVKVETGLKSTYQHYDSQADYFLSAGGGLVGDPARTNAFRYRETIHAAYAQASKTLPGNFTLKAGTRMEYTHMKGNQTIPSDTSFLIKRADFFPYVYLSLAGDRNRPICTPGFHLPAHHQPPRLSEPQPLHPLRGSIPLRNRQPGSATAVYRQLRSQSQL